MDTIIMQRRWWIGHVIRRERDSVSKKAVHLTPEGRRKWGRRPKNTWRRTIETETRGFIRLQLELHPEAGQKKKSYGALLFLTSVPVGTQVSQVKRTGITSEWKVSIRARSIGALCYDFQNCARQNLHCTIYKDAVIYECSREYFQLNIGRKITIVILVPGLERSWKRVVRS